MVPKAASAGAAAKAADAIFVVAAVERTELPIKRAPEPQDLREPLELKNRIVGDLAGKVLPLLDSRTRYWRYYLLIGPHPTWAHRSLGNRLLKIVRQNRGTKDQRATRGIGSRLFNRCYLDLGRRPNDPELKRLVRNFRIQYGAAAKQFWKQAEGMQGDEVLRTASQHLRSTHSFAGFFGRTLRDAPDGHARRAFHRIIRDQTEAGRELARLVQRRKSLGEAIASVKRTTMTTDEARRLVLAWALLAALYEREEGKAPSRVQYDDDDVEGDEDKEIVFEGRLAMVAKHMLQGGVGDLDPETRRHVIALLDGALRNKPYCPPCRVPTVMNHGSRRRLFADLRLTSFRRLLSQTS